MKNWLAFVLGVYGYLVAILFYEYSYSTSNMIRALVASSCVTCTHVDRFGGGIPWRAVLLVFAPTNSMLYAASGIALGWLVIKVRRRPVR
jgi:hypothetical protein